MLQNSSLPTLQFFSNSDWVECLDDRFFKIGYSLFFGPNIISWSSCKYKIIFMSSIGAKYKAIANTTVRIIWINSLSKLGITLPQPPILWYDNINTTYLTANSLFHSCTKHISIDYHFVRN